MRDVTVPAHPFSSACFIPNHQDHRKQREKLFNIVFFAIMKRFLRSAIVATSLFTSPSKAFQKSQQQLASSTSSSTLIMSHPSPELTVYDMDACLWDQEMYTMRSMPGKKVMGNLNGRGEGVIGVMSGGDKISLHKGSLISLQEHNDGKYPGMKIAMASSADTPFAEKVGRASLKMLEVVPGVTVWDILMRDWDGRDVNQIGRQPPLSSNKSKTHFPLLRKETGIRYDRMLFFDDCNWGDHCGMVEQNCREEDTGLAPVTVRTPRGLGEAEWREGLKKCAERNTST
jgi:magnesium-dependent phosphatase 1